MTTYIKGTFPVRFRRDGKDGVNVWLKYASVLDKYDSNTDKHYPSKIFNEPTAECKYIGIGKGVGDEPTQGQYYDWKKYIGDDGTSFTAKGQAIAHYTTLTAYNSASKTVGLYLVDNMSGALLKYWNGSASGDRSVTDGDAYTTADKHLWIKDGVKWNDLGEIKGPKGDPGDDAVSYKLSSSISAIPLDNDAYPTVSSFTLTAYKFVGNASATFDDSYTLVAVISYSGSTTPITVTTKLSTSGSKMTVYLRAGGLSSGSLLKDIKGVTCTLYHGQSSLDSFTILPIKAGAAGVSYFPNMCGVWDGANVTYKWTNGSRDMVTYYISGTPYLFAVKTAGTTISANVNNATPDKDSRWEKADSPFSMLFANFVYTNNASVAGFKWSDEVMQSPNGLLELNGKTGKITAKNGTIGGIDINESGIFHIGSDGHGFFIGSSGSIICDMATITGKITATSGTFDNCTINETCDIKGKLVGAYGQFGAWEIAAYGGYDLICKQSVDVLFEMTNTKHNTRSIVLRTTNGLSTSQGDGSTDSVPMVRVVTDNGVGGEFTANNSGGYALKAYGYNGAAALYVSGLSYFSGNVSMSLYTTIPTIKGYLYRDSNGFVKIKI